MKLGQSSRYVRSPKTISISGSSICSLSRWQPSPSLSPSSHQGHGLVLPRIFDSWCGRNGTLVESVLDELPSLSLVGYDSCFLLVVVFVCFTFFRPGCCCLVDVSPFLLLIGFLAEIELQRRVLIVLGFDWSSGGRFLVRFERGYDVSGRTGEDEGGPLTWFRCSLLDIVVVGGIWLVLGSIPNGAGTML